VKTKEAYRLWHNYLVNLKRIDRLTIGEKIDETFLVLLEEIFKGCFAADRFEKLSLVSRAIGKCDILKFFLQLGWEHKVIDHKKYAALILDLDQAGRMLGGWKKSLQEKTPSTR
jgi:hypothetical protein